ncbi:unnamed protein product [Paramecium pentaurelia]|uniref:Transmembrane protein n=1 Tax=Paramecium pentaurelia TaxID=43138 RepID=A0A8S1XH39_9CILI|nr:unnamed protein product [Paramecium pentaurelia]
MFKNFAQGIKQIDRFGVIFRPSVIDINPEYKSIFGGIATLLLYGSCLAYFFYQIIQWQRNTLLPKITSIQTSQSSKYYYMNDIISSFYMRKNYRKDEIDPFDPQNIILQPILSKFKNQQLLESKSFKYDQKSSRYNNTEIILQDLELNLNLENTLDNPQIDYILSFGTCIQEFLLEGQRCANKTLVDIYMQQHSHALLMNNYVKEYNPKTMKLENVKKQSLTMLNNDTTMYFQNQIRISKTKIDNGFLFPSETQQEFPVDIIMISQSIDIDSFQTIFYRATYLVLAYSLSETSQEQFIEYPKLSEVLADIGSIVSIILVLSHLCLLINEQKLEKECIQKIITMYYPETVNIKFKYNWYGKIIDVLQNDRSIDKVEFLKYYNEIKRVAIKKLNIANIIYTQAKLQFLIQSTYSQIQIKQAHKVGIRLKSFPKLQDQTNIEENQKNIPIGNYQIHDISNMESTDQNDNIISSSLKKISLNENPKFLFIKPQNDCHILNDEDFHLFTFGESIIKDNELNKQDCYFEKNYIDI